MDLLTLYNRIHNKMKSSENAYEYHDEEKLLQESVESKKYVWNKLIKISYFINLSFYSFLL